MFEDLTKVICIKSGRKKRLIDTDLILSLNGIIFRIELYLIRDQSDEENLMGDSW